MRPFGRQGVVHEWNTFYLAELLCPTPRPPQQALRCPNDLKLMTAQATEKDN